jgi:sulfur carrier protein ThiS
MRVKVFPPYGCDRSALDAKSWMELPEGSTVSDVLKQIKCSPLKAKLLLVSVNGERAKLKHVLQDGDVVGFFSLVTGG